MKIREFIAKRLIPKHTPYCHYAFKEKKPYGVCANPCVFLRIKNGFEYCNYLREYLTIQDQVKDCCINEE